MVLLLKALVGMLLVAFVIFGDAFVIAMLFVAIEGLVESVWPVESSTTRWPAPAPPEAVFMIRIGCPLDESRIFCGPPGIAVLIGIFMVFEPEGKTEPAGQRIDTC